MIEKSKYNRNNFMLIVPKKLGKNKFYNGELYSSLGILLKQIFDVNNDDTKEFFSKINFYLWCHIQEESNGILSYIPTAACIEEPNDKAKTYEHRRNFFIKNLNKYSINYILEEDVKGNNL